MKCTTTSRRKGVLLFMLLFWVPCASLQAMENRQSNSLGMEFILIPPGTFSMGNLGAGAPKKANEVEHQVTLTRPFYMQTTEVTVQQWRAVMGRKFFGGKKGTPDMPVVRVSWQDCMEFIQKLNRQGEGTYRLPTEAEWEYACRAGTTTHYSWGRTIDCSKAMYGNNTLKSDECVRYVTTIRDLPADQPAPVKSYSPNPWGLYDLSGNVWEWCRDWYGPYPQKPVKDPQGPASGSVRVRRGGSWYGPGSRCRCANRNFSHPANRYQTTGFRLVKEVENDR
ncbi:MAG: formylglycine-generating enzyme family protein [Desulfobacteraceae bacterium]